MKYLSFYAIFQRFFLLTFSFFLASLFQTETGVNFSYIQSLTNSRHAKFSNTFTLSVHFVAEFNVHFNSTTCFLIQKYQDPEKLWTSFGYYKNRCTFIMNERSDPPRMLNRLANPDYHIITGPSLNLKKKNISLT